MDGSDIQIGWQDAGASAPAWSLLPAELRLLAMGDVPALLRFADLGRLDAVDPKGDTPLHIVARRGLFLPAEAFLAGGANASARNLERLTPAQCALIEGHATLAAHLARRAHIGPQQAPADDETAQVAADTTPEDDLALAFTVEEAPEDFHQRHAGAAATGLSVRAAEAPGLQPDEAAWEVSNLFADEEAEISGEGILSPARAEEMRVVAAAELLGPWIVRALVTHAPARRVLTHLVSLARSGEMDPAEVTTRSFRTRAKSASDAALLHAADQLDHLATLDAPGPIAIARCSFALEALSLRGDFLLDLLRILAAEPDLAPIAHRVLQDSGLAVAIAGAG